MISCRELIGFLDDYVAGVQTEPVRQEFERHLAACPRCIDYLRTYRATMTLCRATREADAEFAEPPADLVKAVLAARRQAL